MDRDEDLVALIDGELEEPRKGELLGRLANDADLRGRYEALRATSAPVGAAFDLALAQAPVDRLRGFLPPPQAEAQTARAPRGGLFALRSLAAGFVLGAVLAGAVALYALGVRRDEGDWRSAVISYMELYTKETFAFPPPDPQAQAQMLAAVGGRVGVSLAPAAVSAPGVAFKVAFSLGYEGTPLAEVAYVDPSGEPVLLCVLGKGGADAPLRLERRESYALANWTRTGRQFLVVARLPEARVAEIAQSLQARL